MPGSILEYLGFTTDSDRALQILLHPLMQYDKIFLDITQALQIVMNCKNLYYTGVTIQVHSNTEFRWLENKITK